MLKHIGLLTMQAGAVLLDGEVLGYIDHHFLHEQISIVSQVRSLILDATLLRDLSSFLTACSDRE